MNSDFPRLRRFLAAVHRRAILLRLAECVGIASAVAALVAIAYMLTRFHDASPKGGLTAAMIGVGAAAGVIWCILRRPSRLQTAITADRQLQLDDLLGTAASITRGKQSAEPWAQSVLAVAEIACARHSAGAVKLHRIGSRGWGAISLCIAMSLTLALLASSAASDAESRRTQLAATAGPASAQPPHRSLVAIAPESPLGTHVSTGADDQGNPAGQNDPDRVAARPPGSPDTQPPGDQQPGGVTPGDPGGTGSGFGKTNRSPTPPITPSPGDATTSTQQPTAVANGSRPGGGGVNAAAPSASAQSNGSTGRTSAAGTAVSIPPWQSDRWAADAQAAEQQLTSGGIAPQYRDLVRKYFDVR